MASVPLQARALLGWDKEDFVAAMESLTLEQRIPILEVCAADLAPGGAINFLSPEARMQIQQTIKDTLNAGDPVSDTHNNAESTKRRGRKPRRCELEQTDVMIDEALTDDGRG